MSRFIAYLENLIGKSDNMITGRKSLSGFHYMYIDINLILLLN
jgi:hypothetical protein